MRTHPFSAALRLWERRLALATELGLMRRADPVSRWRECRNRRAIRSQRALDGEALAALRAAGVDHFAAARGLHANAEAMGALTARHGRLESTFHVDLTCRESVAGLLAGIHRADIAAGNRMEGCMGSRISRVHFTLRPADNQHDQR
ncbi:conserved protein of unknown function [Paraburkholderia kururiensis]